MPAEQAMGSPYGNGPDDIGSAVPTDPSGQQALESSPSPQMGPAPAAPDPAPTPPQQQGANLFDQELSRVQKGQGRPHNPFAEMDPNLPLGYTPLSPRLRKSPTGEMEHLRNDGKWAPFGDAENAIAGQIMQGLNQFAIRSKEDIPRVIGAIAGTALAERVGLGPWASAFVAGGSQAVAGALGDKAIHGKDPTAMGVGLDMAIGGGSHLLLGEANQFVKQKAVTYGAEAAISPTIRRGGEELIQRQADELAAAQAIGAKPGPTLTQQDIAAVQRMGPEAQKLYQMNWGKAAQLRESFSAAVSKLMGNSAQELGVEDPNYYKIIGNVLKSTGETTTKLKGVAKEVSGDAVHEIDPVLSKMREEIGKIMPKGATIFDDSGKINSRLLSDAKDKYPTLFSKGSRELVNVYNELYTVTKSGAGTKEAGTFMNSTAADELLEPVARQNADVYSLDIPRYRPSSDAAIMEDVERLFQASGAPRSTPGLTMDEMDAYRAAFGRKANFQSITRDATNDAYARMHHVMSDHLDTKMIEALGKAGKQQEASQLMGAKDFYSGFKETAEALQQRIAHDPENAARSLVDVKNPAQVKQLWAMLTPEQQGHLSGSYLNTLLDPVIDETTGRMKIATAENQWVKVDPKVKQIMFGKEGTAHIEQMINYAKGINLKAPGTYNPQADGLMSKFMALAHNTNPIKGAMNFFSSLFSRNPKAADYVAENLSGVLMPTGADSVSLMKKQMLMNKMSQGMASRWTRYGAVPVITSDIETEHKQEIRPSGR